MLRDTKNTMYRGWFNHGMLQAHAHLLLPTTYWGWLKAGVEIPCLNPKYWNAN